MGRTDIAICPKKRSKDYKRIPKKVSKKLL